MPTKISMAFCLNAAKISSRALNKSGKCLTTSTKPITDKRDMSITELSPCACICAPPTPTHTMSSRKLFIWHIKSAPSASPETSPATIPMTIGWNLVFATFCGKFCSLRLEKLASLRLEKLAVLGLAISVASAAFAARSEMVCAGALAYMRLNSLVWLSF